MGIDIRLLKPFGAVVGGIDLSQPLADADFKRILDTFNQHALLVFPAQRLDDDTQTAFSARFGPLEMRPTELRSQQRNPDMRAEVNDLSNVDKDNNLLRPGDDRALAYEGNMLWHTDSSYKTVPATASLLSAREIPPEGGETEFADMRAAWDALLEEKRRSLEGLVAEHSAVYSRKLVGFIYAPDEQAALPPALQPLMRTHPVTGRKSIYVASHASHIIGWPAEKGRALLDELTEFATQPQFVYQHRWGAGDLVMWDNRCTLHRLRPWDVARYKRVMRRTTVAGNGPTVVNGRPVPVG